MSEYHEFREPAWRCSACDYEMNACSIGIGEGDRPPDQGDITLCLNCGTAYQRDSLKHWNRLGPEDILKLVPESSEEIKRAQRVLKWVVPLDLAIQQRFENHG